VGDLAARDFALTLYARLLWMKAADGGGGAIGSGLRSEVGAYVADSSDPDSFYMFRAMQEARRTIAALHRDIKTWGAYQHYGNPYYRFFTPERDAGTELVDDVQRARHAMAPGVPLRTQTANSIIQLPPSQVVKTIIGEPPQILRLTQITKFLRVQEARTDFGVSGAGLAVAVIDTGLNVHHVAFAGNGKIAARHNFVDSPGDAQDVEDTDGHGTHVAGLIAANSALLTGIAPEASVIPLRIAKETQVSLILKNTLNPALQWVLDNHKAHTITAVNLSFGGGNWQTGDEFIAATTMLNQAAAPVLIDLFKQLRGKNIAVVVSAGNDYPGSEGMAFPAIVPYCISVGSVFDADIGSFSIDNGRFIAFSTAAGRITPYSQRLHKPDDAQKPYTTVFAPGSIATSAGIIGNNQSVDKNGTSQAAPVITGLILLMQELYMRNNGGKLPPVDKLVEWLRKGGETIKDGDDEKDNVKHTDKEYVRIDALKALQAVQ
jgi:subtilisin family serine protease